MAGLLWELRRQLAGNHRKNKYENSAVSQRAARTVRQEDLRRQEMSNGRKRVEEEDSRSQGPAGRKEEGMAADRGFGEELANNTCERTQDIVNKDDFLLQQIDEFRDRAQQLQELMNCREAEMRQMELERQKEEERQNKQRRLELESQKEQEFAMPQGQQTNLFEHAPYDMAASAIETGIREDQMQRIEELLQKRDENTADITAEVEHKIDEMIAQVSAKISELDLSVRESVDGEAKISAQRAEELKESLGQIQDKLESLKADLSDKVHSENVKCYRNIQELLKNMEGKLNAVGALEQKLRATRTCVTAVLIVALLNLIAILGVMLTQFGVIAIR